MRDEDKVKDQLKSELRGLGQRAAELEALEAGHKKSEEALRDSEENFRTLFEYTPGIAFVIDENTRLIAANSLYRSILGDHVGTKALEREGVSKATREFWHKIEKQVIDSGWPAWYTEIVETRKRGTVYYENRLRPIKRNGKVTMVIGVAHDATERKRAEEALRESQEKYRQLVSTTTDAIMVFDVDTRQFIEVNKACEDLYGYSRKEFLNLKHTDITAEPEKSEDSIKRTLSGELSKIPVRYHKKKDATIFPVEISASSFELKDRRLVCGVIRDITERRILEAQLLKAKKMEAIGTLAGGIAHEFNNLLQVVHGYVELLLWDKKKDDPDYKNLLEIMNAALRGSGLTKQLLAFSRGMESKKLPVDLNHIVEQAYRLLKRTLPTTIKFELRLANDLKAINADPTQIKDVLLALAVNAKDALPEGGIITIETVGVILDKGYCCTRPEAKPGEYLRLTISDTGQGMDPNTLEHIFDPFYTTRGFADRSGLGLPMVYGIVNSHGGYIECSSELGVGTSFEIYLPATEQEIESEEPTEVDVLNGGTKTILIVDDEQAIHDLGKKILTKFGFAVLTAPNGETAQEIYRREQERIDLVIVDLIMPGISGRQLIEWLLEINPQAKVVVATGYSDVEIMEESIKAGAKGLISKPYEMRQMLQIVRDVLDED